MDDETKAQLDQAFESDLAKAREKILQEEAHKLAMSGLASGSKDFNEKLSRNAAQREDDEQLVPTLQNLHYGELGGVEEVERLNEEWRGEQDEPDANIQDQQEEEKRKAQEIQNNQTELPREEEQTPPEIDLEDDKKQEEQEQEEREVQAEVMAETAKEKEVEVAKQQLRNDFARVNKDQSAPNIESSDVSSMKQEVKENEQEERQQLWNEFKAASRGRDRDERER